MYIMDTVYVLKMGVNGFPLGDIPILLQVELISVHKEIGVGVTKHMSQYCNFRRFFKITKVLDNN